MLTILGLAAVGSILVWKVKKLDHFPIPSRRNQLETHATLHSVDNIPQREEKIRLKSGQRLIALALFILLALVITTPLANKILDRQSNTANLLLLFGYTGLDIVAAYMVGVVRVGGIFSAIGYLIALLAVFSYNLWICAFLARLRQGQMLY